MPMIDRRPARTEVRLAEVLELLGWTARARRGARGAGARRVSAARVPVADQPPFLGAPGPE